MPFQLDKYLFDAGIRMIRDNWRDTRPFSQEWYAILRGIQVQETGPISFEGPDGDPTNFPSIPDLDIPPFDLDFPENGPTPNETDVDDAGNVTIQTWFFHRAAFPGKVISHAGGTNYNVTIYPNDNLASSSGTQSDIQTKTVVARVADESLAGTVANNSWVPVFYVAEYQVTENRFAGGGSNTALQIVQQDFSFIPPGGGGGGKVARVTTTITAGTATAPGKGRGILKNVSVAEDGTASYADGEEVDIYNSVSSSIAVDSDNIQLKRIDNLWFIDVEDCGGSSDGGVVNE